MKSWQLDKFGIDHLALREQPKPVPGRTEILVRTGAVSLNFRDRAIIEGSYHSPVSFPMVPGSDVAGEVVSTGSGVTRFQPGDKVVSVFQPLWLDGVAGAEAQRAKLGSPLPGVFSEYVLLSEEGALRYPKYLSAAQASTLPIAAVTAWVALFERAPFRAHDSVLIRGSGGVSLFGLQLAVAHGAKVIATSRSADKLLLLRELGASHVIDTGKLPYWDDEVLSATGGKGVNHVLEVVGGESVQRSINASAQEGHIAIIGLMESPSISLSVPSIIGKQINLHGVSVGSRSDMSHLLAFLEEHPIQPVIDATYRFDALPDALAHLIRGPFGKIVLEV